MTDTVPLKTKVFDVNELMFDIEKSVITQAPALTENQKIMIGTTISHHRDIAVEVFKKRVMRKYPYHESRRDIKQHIEKNIIEVFGK